jgi:hypothetical protein
MNFNLYFGLREHKWQEGENYIMMSFTIQVYEMDDM